MMAWGYIKKLGWTRSMIEDDQFPHCLLSVTPLWFCGLSVAQVEAFMIIFQSNFSFNAELWWFNNDGLMGGGTPGHRPSWRTWSCPKKGLRCQELPGSPPASWTSTAILAQPQLRAHPSLQLPVPLLDAAGWNRQQLCICQSELGLLRMTGGPWIKYRPVCFVRFWANDVLVMKYLQFVAFAC